MNRHRELLDTEQTVLCEMANGLVGGRYTYWCRKWIWSFVRSAKRSFFMNVLTEQQRHCGIYSSIVL